MHLKRTNEQTTAGKHNTCQYIKHFCQVIFKIISQETQIGQKITN